MYKQSGNIVDPDQLASQKPADLNLHCFLYKIYPDVPRFYTIDFQDSDYYHVFTSRVENSVDPGQLAF